MIDGSLLWIKPLPLKIRVSAVGFVAAHTYGTRIIEIGNDFPATSPAVKP